MKFGSLLAVGSLAVGLWGCGASGEAAGHGSVLPLRSLKLYETGVGYFERSGTLSKDASVSLPVPTGHLDDALKTLVITGQNGAASISGVEFASSLSRGMARALAGLPADGDEPISYKALLTSLKGADVEIRTKGKTAEIIRGRLVEVLDPEKNADTSESSDAETDEDASDQTKGKRREHAEPPKKKPGLGLLVVTDNGEFEKLDSNDVVSVRPTDPTFQSRVSAALDALSVRSAQNLRALRLLAQSDKPITLGYLAEAPIWRTTYRLVLQNGGERGVLQGWALIHNDTDENWAKVKVELVNGQPDSFLYPLAAPRYARRELAEPQERLATVPQLLDTTVDEIWGDNLDIGTIGHGSGTGTGMGYGSGYGRLGGSHASRAPSIRMGTAVGSSEELKIGNLAAIAPAEGVEAGALFSYTLAEPLDLRAHGSALVPFMASEVLTRRITWFQNANETGRSALRFTNATRQTLPAGPISIYEAGGFAGEAGLDRLKPKERSFLQFGADLDVELELVKDESKDDTQRVSFAKHTLTEDFLRSHVKKIELKNRSRAMRVVYLSLDIVDNSKVEGADELDYDKTGNKPLAVFMVPPGKKLERTLKIQEGLKSTTHVDSLTAERLEQLAAIEKLPSADRANLKDAAARLREAEAKATEKEDTQKSLEEMDGDLKRLREELAALGDKSGQGASANPLVKRILENEDKLLALRQKLKTLDAALKDRRKVAEASLEKLKKEDKDAPKSP
jgi:hypothetical protein